MADADLEQALAIADLGDAIDRKVKTYSQGMRQRLGLARVLLGRPEVLVLDEPTNGLDPGEMREVRQLVRRVAEAGATVLFSSHVLAEVEQICTHAVVMDKGTWSPAGSVADLIGVVGLGLPRGRRRRRRAAGARGSCRSVRARRRRAARPRGRDRRWIAARSSSPRWSHAGVAVETVTARRRLEEAFLGLVEAIDDRRRRRSRTELVKSRRRLRTYVAYGIVMPDPDHHDGRDQGATRPDAPGDGGACSSSRRSPGC